MCEDLTLASDDIRAGLIPGITFGYKPVTYSVVDGLAIFENCISLGRAEEVEQVTGRYTPGPRGSGRRTQGERRAWCGNHWAGISLA